MLWKGNSCLKFRQNPLWTQWQRNNLVILHHWPSTIQQQRLHCQKQAFKRGKSDASHTHTHRFSLLFAFLHRKHKLQGACRWWRTQREEHVPLGEVSEAEAYKELWYPPERGEQSVLTGRKAAPSAAESLCHSHLEDCLTCFQRWDCHRKVDLEPVRTAQEPTSVRVCACFLLHCSGAFWDHPSCFPCR